MLHALAYFPAAPGTTVLPFRPAALLLKDVCGTLFLVTPEIEKLVCLVGIHPIFKKFRRQLKILGGPLP